MIRKHLKERLLPSRSSSRSERFLPTRCKAWDAMDPRRANEVWRQIAIEKDYLWDESKKDSPEAAKRKVNGLKKELKKIRDKAFGIKPKPHFGKGAPPKRRRP